MSINVGLLWWARIVAALAAPACRLRRVSEARPKQPCLGSVLACGCVYSAHRSIHLGPSLGSTTASDLTSRLICGRRMTSGSEPLQPHELRLDRARPDER